MSDSRKTIRGRRQPVRRRQRGTMLRPTSSRRPLVRAGGRLEAFRTSSSFGRATAHLVETLPRNITRALEDGETMLEKAEPAPHDIAASSRKNEVTSPNNERLPRNRQTTSEWLEATPRRDAATSRPERHDATKRRDVDRSKRGVAPSNRAVAGSKRAVPSSLRGTRQSHRAVVSLARRNSSSLFAVGGPIARVSFALPAERARRGGSFAARPLASHIG
jgi:hypothetical protein